MEAEAIFSVNDVSRRCCCQTVYTQSRNHPAVFFCFLVTAIVVQRVDSQHRGF